MLNLYFSFRTSSFLKSGALACASLLLINCSHRLQRSSIAVSNQSTAPQEAVAASQQPETQHTEPAVVEQKPTEITQEVLPTTAEETLPVSKLDAAQPEEDKEKSDEILPPHLDITLETNQYVDMWIKYFTVKDRERFQRFLNRGQRYREVVETVLKENELPEELYYLAMIESGYQTAAKSHANAVGVWQFIAGTGTRYGLRIDKHVDERKDPIRATEAAAKYLRDLYNVFGSWHLAMGAYNSGEIRILRAIMKGRTRNFWELVELGVLPNETAHYVPKFLAVVMIGKNPEKYGFKISDSTVSYPDLEAVEIPSLVPFKLISKHTGISVSEIENVNPHLHHQMTPPSKEPYEVWFATEKAHLVTKNLMKFQKHSRKQRQLADAKNNDSKSVHIVKRGDTLTVIARKYKLSVGHLKRINNLKSQQINVGQKLRVQTKSYKKDRTVKYRVKPGDSLSKIAKKFNTSIHQLMKQNRLRRSHISIGQSLIVSPP